MGGGAAAIDVADPDRPEDDRGDSAGEGEKKAARAEEEEEDGEGAEEEGGECRDVGALGGVRCKPAGGHAAFGQGLHGRGGRAGVLLGRRCAGWHDGGGGRSLDSEDGGADLNLVAWCDLDGSGDALAVHVGAVGGAEVLDHQSAVVGDHACVAA